MTSGGNLNIKQRVSMWAAIVCFAVSAVFGFQFLTSGHLPDQGIAIAGLVGGMFGLVGMWTMGLERRPASTEDTDWDAV